MSGGIWLQSGFRVCLPSHEFYDASQRPRHNYVSGLAFLSKRINRRNAKPESPLLASVNVNGRKIPKSIFASSESSVVLTYWHSKISRDIPRKGRANFDQVCPIRRHGKHILEARVVDVSTDMSPAEGALPRPHCGGLPYYGPGHVCLYNRTDKIRTRSCISTRSVCSSSQKSRGSVRCEVVPIPPSW